MNNGEKPAYPLHGDGHNSGMTKRELIAMHIFAAFLSNPVMQKVEHIPAMAVLAADDLLKELEK